MMAPPTTKQYVAKPHKVQAAQYTAAMTPLPDGVDSCPLFPLGALHAHTDAGMKALHETDWLIWDRKAERLKDVMSDADFQDEFGSPPADA